jgi:hypothetical protein
MNVSSFEGQVVWYESNIIVNIYRSPSGYAVNKDTFPLEFEDEIGRKMLIKEPRPIFVFGDFNIHFDNINDPFRNYVVDMFEKLA